MVTLDHKRIGVMYLAGILISFLLGGVMALLIRSELFTPGKMFLSEDKYNELFTLHGAVMTFLFIIPSIPAALGNFLLPIMLGQKDVAFPRLNLASFYLWVGGVVFFLAGARAGRSRHRLDVLHPLQHDHQWAGRGGDAGRVHSRIQFDFHRTELHCDDQHHAAAGNDLVPDAAVSVDSVRHVDHSAAGNSGAGNHGAAADRGEGPGHRCVRSGTRRRPDSVPALLLVLFAPGGLHHDPAGDGDHQ